MSMVKNKSLKPFWSKGIANRVKVAQVAAHKPARVVRRLVSAAGGKWWYQFRQHS